MTPTAASLGMELTIFKYTLGLFLVYPFSWILYKLPNANLKHLFSFAVGFFLVQWIYGADWIHSFVSSLGIYLIAAIAPGKPKVAFLWAMGYMTMSHIYRMYVSYLTGVFDHTGTQVSAPFPVPSVCSVVPSVPCAVFPVLSLRLSCLAVAANIWSVCDQPHQPAGLICRWIAHVCDQNMLSPSPDPRVPSLLHNTQAISNILSGIASNFLGLAIVCVTEDI